MNHHREEMRAAARQRVPQIAGGLLLVLALFPADTVAEELSGSVTLYGWLPALDVEATSESGGGSVSTSVSASEVLDALKFAFMAAGEVHYGRVGLLQDTIYANLGQDGNLSGPFSSEVDVDVEMLLATLALSYRVYVKDGRLIEPFAGARYVSTKTDATVRGGGPVGLSSRADVDVDWWDPVVGVRGRYPLNEKLTLGGFVDIGGFGAGSQFTWEVFAGIDYAFNETVSANAGLRYISIDYDADEADVNLEMYGPLLGVSLRF